MTIPGKSLTRLFDPATVAVVGASENPGKLGFHVMKSLTENGFSGHVIPINPGTDKIRGLRALPSLLKFDGGVDLAVIVLPAARVPDILRQCAEKQVGGIVLITAGFKEVDDPAGADLHGEAAGIVDRAGIPMIGPNTFGFVNLHNRLNASFTPEFSRLEPGGVALVSQSGGMSHLLGFMAMRSAAAFSKIVGLGNRMNVDFARMVDYLMHDPDTDVIALYMEGIDNPRQLLEVLQKHRGNKPVVAYKTGRSGKSDQASKSHTGSMAGHHAIYRGAFRQAGAISVDSAESLLDAARAFSVCPLPRGPGVAILSGQAGPGMAACDVCEAGGLTVPAFEDKTREKIHALLPPVALRANPVDMGPAWYNAEATRGIISAAMGDANVSGVLLLIMFASANVDVVPNLVDFLLQYRQQKPVLSCILAPPGIWDEPLRRLEQAGALVNHPSPERAAAAMTALWAFAKQHDRPSRPPEKSGEKA